MPTWRADMIFFPALPILYTATTGCSVTRPQVNDNQAHRHPVSVALVLHCSRELQRKGTNIKKNNQPKKENENLTANIKYGRPPRTGCASRARRTPPCSNRRPRRPPCSGYLGDPAEETRSPLWKVLIMPDLHHASVCDLQFALRIYLRCSQYLYDSL